MSIISEKRKKKKHDIKNMKVSGENGVRDAMLITQSM